MSGRLSPRLAEILESLPLTPKTRVLEIGCGPGALARAVAARVPQGFVLGIDRSEKAVRQALAVPVDPATEGVLDFHVCQARDFVRVAGEAPFDVAVAIRVGALDGRHPAEMAATLKAIAGALTRRGRLFTDGGAPLREIDLGAYR